MNLSKKRTGGERDGNGGRRIYPACKAAELEGRGHALPAGSCGGLKRKREQRPIGIGRFIRNRRSSHTERMTNLIGQQNPNLALSIPYPYPIHTLSIPYPYPTHTLSIPYPYPIPNKYCPNETGWQHLSTRGRHGCRFPKSVKLLIVVLGTRSLLTGLR